MFHYQSALVREMAESFEESLKQLPAHSPIDVALAKVQHDSYIKVLKSLLDRVTIVSKDNRYPDCNFIEDTAVIIQDRALITFLGAAARRGEVDAVRSVLRKNLSLKIFTMDYPATLDGGDVLFTGNHLFVGLSARTNDQGAKSLSDVFGDLYPVVPIPVTAGLHLKSLISVLSEKCLVVAQTPAAQKIKTEILKADPSYTFIEVPDQVAANVLRINNGLLIQKGYPESEAILENAAMAHQLEIHKLSMSELIKADGALTCGSLLH